MLNNLGVVAQRRHRYLTATRRFRDSLAVHPLPTVARNLKQARRSLWVLPLMAAAALVLAVNAPVLLILMLVIRGGRYALRPLAPLRRTPARSVARRCHPHR